MKGLGIVIILIVAGAVILFLSFYGAKPSVNQGVVLNDLFPQHPSQVTSSVVEKKNTVPPLAIVASPVTSPKAGYIIQVYSFQDKNRAENSLKSLKNSGYQAFLIVTDLGPKGIWYRVRVGGIMDEIQAHKMLESIRKNYNSGFLIHGQVT